MIKRKIQKELLALSLEYPIITVIGPRQSGKTTLVKMSFPKYKYCSLENPDIRAYAQDDPRAFLKEFSSQVIFDEVQRVPELLSYIQEMVDSSEDKGQFILTGSHQMKLHAEISQSLAGRADILTLLPLSLEEIKGNLELKSRNNFLYKGFFPRVHNDNLNPTKAYANYY